MAGCADVHPDHRNGLAQLHVWVGDLSDALVVQACPSCQNNAALGQNVANVVPDVCALSTRGCGG